MLKCQFCSHRNPSAADVCEECGASILDRDRKPTVDLGDDTPERILNFVVDAFQREQGIDLRADATVLPRLEAACEKAATELQSAESTEINLPFIAADATGPKHLNISITRSQFQFQHARSESDQVLDLLRSGQKIAAVKLYREQYGVGLKEAKDAVEDLGRRNNIASGGGGCASVLVLLLVSLGAVISWVL